MRSGLFGVTPVPALRTGSVARLEFSPAKQTKQTTFSSNAEKSTASSADAPAPRIEAARAEAERLVAEAENVGREAFTRLKSASAKFGTRAGADRRAAAPRAKA